MKNFNITLFDGFETLDAFGPAEVIGSLPGLYELGYYSLNGGIVESSQKVKVQTLPFSDIDTSGVLLIPGGIGTISLVNDENFVEQLKILSEKAFHVLTVCTGSALIAKTGLLNGLKATTNKTDFEWASSNGPRVKWIKKARWVKDGKYYTSSGVSAGIDMSLGFVGDLHGMETVRKISKGIEYVWNPNPENDPFAVE